MKRAVTLLGLAIVVVALFAFLAACKSSSGPRQVVVKCDNCQTVGLYANFQAGEAIAQVKPGDQGTVDDNRWSTLKGCMMYHLVVGTQNGWLCEKYLTFK